MPFVRRSSCCAGAALLFPLSLLLTSSSCSGTDSVDPQPTGGRAGAENGGDKPKSHPGSGNAGTSGGSTGGANSIAPRTNVAGGSELPTNGSAGGATPGHTSVPPALNGGAEAQGGAHAAAGAGSATERSGTGGDAPGNTATATGGTFGSGGSAPQLSGGAGLVGGYFGAGGDAQLAGNSGSAGSVASTGGTASCTSRVILAEALGSTFDQYQLGTSILEHMFMGSIDNTFGTVSIGREPTQTVYGHAFSFAATQQVASIDVQVVVQSATPTEVSTILGARLARPYGPYWSRMVHTASWGPLTQTLQISYTPAPPYFTGPISATSANETAFAVEMAFRSTHGADAVVRVDGFRIRLVYADASTTGWTNPGAVNVDLFDAGWYNLTRLAAADSSEAAIDSQPNIAGTAILRSTGYGFSIPNTATITGVELPMIGRTGTDVDYFVRHARLTANGSAIGANRASRTVLPKTAFPAIGGEQDTWQVPLTSSLINRSDFGVEVSFFVEQASNYGGVRLDALPLRIWGCP